MFLVYNFTQLLNIHLFIEITLFVAILYRLFVLSMLAIKKKKPWPFVLKLPVHRLEGCPRDKQKQCSEGNDRQMQNHKKSSEQGFTRGIQWEQLGESGRASKNQDLKRIPKY